MLRYEIEFRERRGWAPLSWVARLSPAVLEVDHGINVEVRNNFFAEAVWDGAFELGEIHETDLVFGSGAVLSDSVLFVSSGSTVDRLYMFSDDTVLLVSNSLPALASMAPGFDSHGGGACFPAVNWVQRGIRRDPPAISNPFGSGGTLTAVYFYNIKFEAELTKGWKFSGLVEKPGKLRQFEGYHDYIGFIESALRRIGQNGRDPGRKRPYNFFSSISTGYDSTFVSALAVSTDLTRRAFTIPQGRHGLGDSGREVGENLGLSVEEINRFDWKRRLTPPLEDAYRSSGLGSDISLTACNMENGVFLSGFHGDGVWNKKLTNVSENLPRKDLTGLSLTEWRLWVTALHLPVPFMGARALESINRVSNSSEMKNWDIKGSHYSRPIPRRYLEEAGVPRGSFGTHKKVTAIGAFETGSTRDARRRYLQQLPRPIRFKLIVRRAWGRLFSYDPAKLTRRLLFIVRFVPGVDLKRVQTHVALSGWQRKKIRNFPLSTMHFRATAKRYWLAREWN